MFQFNNKDTRMNSFASGKTRILAYITQRIYLLTSAENVFGHSVYYMYIRLQYKTGHSKMIPNLRNKFGV